MNTKANIEQSTENPERLPVLPYGFSTRRFARLIGVSHNTVARVISNPARVSDETRQMVIEKLWEHYGHLQPASP